jgi:hypothetical protein
MDERSANLRLNEFLRNSDGVKKSDGVRWSLSIPYDDWAALGRLNPALRSKDPVEKTKAWKAFINSPESIPYRVMEMKA